MRTRGTASSCAFSSPRPLGEPAYEHTEISLVFEGLQGFPLSSCAMINMTFLMDSELVSCLL